MKVFISCSGETSFRIGEALRAWLPTIIQAVKPWVSSKDIEKGSRWGLELTNQLQETKSGIICLTKDNLEAPWILFEAGALSKTVVSSHVCPYLFHLNRADVKGPLSSFQMTVAEKEETRNLLDSINESLEAERLAKEVLDVAFNRGWPEFEKKLNEIPVEKREEKADRTDRDLLEEILLTVRNLEREKPSTAIERELAVKYLKSLGRGKLITLAEILKERLTPSLAPSKAVDYAEEDLVEIDKSMRTGED